MPGHVFLSYVREDATKVDRLQNALEAAGISVWRDTRDIGPGLDWRMEIRRAITENALVFIACFSEASVTRDRTIQHEELTLAIEEYRLRRRDRPWLIPVRFSDCRLPRLDIGAGLTLDSLNWLDLFEDNWERGCHRLIEQIHPLLAGQGDRAPSLPPAKPVDRGRARIQLAALMIGGTLQAVGFGMLEARLGPYVAYARHGIPYFDLADYSEDLPDYVGLSGRDRSAYVLLLIGSALVIGGLPLLRWYARGSAKAPAYGGLVLFAAAQAVGGIMSALLAGSTVGSEPALRWALGWANDGTHAFLLMALAAGVFVSSAVGIALLYIGARAVLPTSRLPWLARTFAVIASLVALAWAGTWNPFPSLLMAAHAGFVVTLVELGNRAAGGMPLTWRQVLKTLHQRPGRARMHAPGTDGSPPPPSRQSSPSQWSPSS
jgi:hypothetical protein